MAMTDTPWKGPEAADQRTIWEETERNFWNQFQRDQAERRRDAERSFQKESLDTQIELSGLDSKRRQLNEARERATRDLLQIEQQLAKVGAERDFKANELEKARQKHSRTSEEMSDTGERVYRSMIDFFREKHGKAPLSDKDLASISVAAANAVKDVKALEPPVTLGQASPYSPRALAQGQGSRSATHSPRNTNINEVERISPRLPLSRARPPEQMIDSPRDQAPTPMERTRLPDESRSHYDPVRRTPLQGSPTSTSAWPRLPSTEQRLAELAYAQVRPRDPRYDPIPSGKESEPLPRRPLVNGHSRFEGRTALPEPRGFVRTSSFTPANTHVQSRPPSRDHVTPRSTIEVSPQPNRASPEAPLEEITRSNLTLRHNGFVYVYPECVAGVPLAKIDPSHPYWEPAWKDIRRDIERQRGIWKEKHQAAIEAEARGEKSGSSKYQIGRQVNRGGAILEFLDKGEFSPYQLLSKRYQHSPKGGITSYDTLFRLAETVAALEKFNLDVKPAEWIRQRLHELHVEHGDRFNMPKIIHDFYHDPKLAALRRKHGIRDIGRPSGAGTKQTAPANRQNTPRTSLNKKRKSPHSQHATPSLAPREMTFIDQSPTVAANAAAAYERSPSGQEAKRLKPTPPPSVQGTSTEATSRPGSAADAGEEEESKEPAIEDHKMEVDAPEKQETPKGLEADARSDITEADSVTGTPISEQEFRVFQIKTRLHTSSAKVTQYWCWNPEEEILEHQVLGSVEPVEWNLLRQPVDFSLRLETIAAVHFKEGSTLARVVLNEGESRGDLLVKLKRWHTVKRLIAFLEKRGVKLEDDLGEDDFERRWEEMRSSEQLSEDDSAENTIEVKE